MVSLIVRNTFLVVVTFVQFVIELMKIIQSHDVFDFMTMCLFQNKSREHVIDLEPVQQVIVELNS
jgi:hypothetical protein